MAAIPIFDSVQKHFPAIHRASGEFVSKLTGADVVKDISLAGEMAGLMMLRASGVDLGQYAPGTVLIGAVADDVGIALSSFALGYAKANGMDPNEMDLKSLSADDKRYLSELTQYEEPFYVCCKQNGVNRELWAFVAAASAMKLVLAGKQLGVMEAKMGLALAMFHVAAGSKTVPYPLASAS